MLIGLYVSPPWTAAGSIPKVGEKQSSLLWYLFAGILLIAMVELFLTQPQAAMIPYSDFKALLLAGKVTEATIGQDTIRAVIDLRGAEKLLPPAEYKAIKEPSSAGQSPTLPFGSPEPVVPTPKPSPQPAAAPARGPPTAEERAPASQTAAQSRPDLHPIETRRVDDPQLVSELQAAHVRYSAAPQSTWLWTILSWVLPAIVLVALWNMMAGKGAGTGVSSMMGIGQSRAKVFVESKTKIRFADVAGIDEAKEELMEVVQFLRDPEHFRRLGGKIPKGILIVGAPGTGKTLLAKAVAGEAGVPFLSISGSEFVEMFVGVGAARVRDLFAQAQKLAPCIIFIDELDALGKARGIAGLSSNDEREQTLNQLLVQMDGFDTQSGVIILAATNRPEILDPALLRPGRFDRHVAVDRPDIKGREQILKVHARGVVLAPEVDLAVIAAKTPGFAGADLANIVNEAALHAARTDKAAVDMKDFDEAIDRVVAGLEKRNRVMNPKEKETVAYHEAGHALVAESRAHADKVSKISIIPRGIGALGYTQQLPTEDRYLLKRSELLDRLDVLLGGRVAEELVYDDVSTGAQDDLQRATDMARHMITQYGMSDRLGQVTFDAPRSAFLSTPDGASRGNYSEETAKLIDEEIARLIREAHVRVRRTLMEERAALDALAGLLLEHEVVERAALDELLRGQPAAQRADNRPITKPTLEPEAATSQT
ncbi:MAG TPA: ATP-dependent zinc metalloprotease FtsH [Steroidobacteraceae bacterium]|nr:ATP-dependent zinc metalloprotease FtsH [Steroidobacteraceae bacterium]